MMQNVPITFHAAGAAAFGPTPDRSERREKQFNT